VGRTLPRIGNLVDRREAQVKSDIDQAAAAKAEADRVREAYEADMARARDGAHSAVGEAQARAAKLTETRLHAANEASGAKLDQAMAQLADARSRATGEIAAIAAAAAADIVERISGNRPDEATARGAVEQVA
jgi:F-type H+-transporting ATPase subunit b